MSKGPKRIALLGVISPALFAVGAMGQPIQLHSTLAGNNPSIVIGGVESASSPWTVKSGLASLDASGKLHVRVRDLILPATGDAGPVTAVSASLVCGGSGGTMQSETAPAPLSMKAVVNDMVFVGVGLGPTGERKVCTVSRSTAGMRPRERGRPHYGEAQAHRGLAGQAGA